MDEIMKDLETTFNLISTIPVSGNAVEAMAEARARLRHAFAELKKEAELKKNEGADK